MSIIKRKQVEKQLTKSEKPNLGQLVKLYYAKNEIKKEVTKEVDALNKQIKELINEQFEIEGIIANKSIQERVSIDEDKLLEILDSCHHRDIGLIKNKPYVDLEKLEKLIEEGEINPLLLSDAQVIKEVVTLNVSKKKEEKEP